MNDQSRPAHLTQWHLPDVHFALKAAKLGAWELDPISDRFTFDERSRELLGLDKNSSLDYQQLISHIHLDDRQHADMQFRLTMNPGTLSGLDVICRTADSAGNFLYMIRLVGQCEFSASGHVQRFAGVAQDVTSDQDKLPNVLTSITSNTEQKTAQEALRQSEEKYNTLFNSMDQGCYLAEVIFDEHNQPADIFYHDANPAAFRMTGQDFKGKFLRELEPGYEAYWYDIFGRVAKTGQGERMQKYAAPDQKWYDFYVFKIGQTGSRIAVMFQDITQRARHQVSQAFLAKITNDLSRLSTAKEIMKTVGEKISTYLQAKSCLFVDVDELRGEVTVFDAWSAADVPSLRYQKIRLSDFLNEEFSRANRAGDLVVVRDTNADPRAEGKDYSGDKIGAFVTVPFHRNGVWTNYLAVTDSHPRDWRDDEIELFRELSNRIFPRLERARAEESLRRLEQRTRIAIEAADLATWEWNLMTDQVYWNEQHYRLLGIQAPADVEQLSDAPRIPSDFMRYVHADDLDLIQADLARAIREQSLYDADFRIVRSDGTVRWMKGFGRITAVSEGRATRFSGVMFDIDQRKQTEQALIKADKNKDLFLATLAHELRNPLAPIRSMLQVLLVTMGDNQVVNDAVSMMNRQVEQLVRLIDDLMDLSRISRGTVQLRSQRLDFNDVVRHAIEATGALYQSGQRVLTVDLPSAPVFLDGDMSRLVQAVSNLLNNAAKFTSEGGRVEIAVRKDGSDAVITVHDNGIGIAVEDLERIFELFAQSDSSLERSHGGLGLGLTLVRQLVELHGGQVIASSLGYNQGSQFTIFLPASAQTP